MARDIEAEPLTEQELLDLVASSPKLMRTITDADPRVKLHELLYANKTALDGIRTEARDVIGRPFWDTPWFSTTEGMSAVVREAFLLSAFVFTLPMFTPAIRTSAS